MKDGKMTGRAIMRKAWKYKKKMLAVLLTGVMSFYAMPLQSLAWSEQVSMYEMDTPSSGIMEMVDPEREESATEIAELDSETKIPYVLYEDPSLRTENEKQFRMSDGSYTLTQYPRAVHYQQGEEWEEIDNTLTRQGEMYRNADSDVHYSFSANTMQTPSVRAEWKDYAVSFTTLPHSTNVPSGQIAQAEDAVISQPENEPGEEQETTLPENETQTETEESFAEQAPSDVSNTIESSSDVPVTPSNDVLTTTREDVATQESTEKAVEETAPTEEEIIQTQPSATQSANNETTVSEVMPGVSLEGAVAVAKPYEIDLSNPPSVQAVVPQEKQSAAWAADQSIARSVASVSYEQDQVNTQYTYTLQGRDLKEEIIVSSPQTQYVYAFRLNLTGLEAELEEDGSVTLHDAQTTVFTIPAPHMRDAQGETSTDAAYTLQQISDGIYVLTLTADATWMNDAARAFPVAIDPSLFASRAANSSITTRYISDSDLVTQHENEEWMFVGSTSEYGKAYSFVKFNNLPVLPYDSKFCKAWMLLPVPTGSGVFDNESLNDFALLAQQALPAWGSQFESTPQNNPNPILDFELVSTMSPGTTLSFEISAAASKWYANSTENTGIVLYGERSNGQPMGNGMNALLCLCGNATATDGTKVGPVLQVNYRHARGIEDYYTYETVDARAAGTAYISHETGKMTLVYPTVSDESYTLSHVYNSHYGDWIFTDNEAFHTVDYSRMFVGAGWKLSAQQSVVTELFTGPNGDIGEYAIYTDADGTEHYFHTVATETFKDEDGLGLTLVRNNQAHTFTMTDDQGGEMLFVYGYLTRTKDANGNITAFVYNGKNYSSTNTTWYPTGSTGQQLTKIVQHNNGKSSYTVATLQYDNNVLESITNRDGMITEMNYAKYATNIYVLSNIVVNDGQNELVRRYTYGANASMVRALDEESGNGVKFAYGTGKPSVNEIQRFFLDKQTNAEVTQTRICLNVTTPGMSKIRDCGNDLDDPTGDDLLTTVCFDDFGRTVSSVTTDFYGSIVSVSGGSYTANSGTEKTNNRLLTTGSAGNVAQNMLLDGDMESGSNWGNQILVTGKYNNGLSSAQHRSGSKSMGLNLEDASTSATVWQGVSVPVAGVYTVSAYVKTKEDYFQTSTGANAGFCLQVEEAQGNIVLGSPNATKGTMLRQDRLRHETDPEIDNGWQRIATVVRITQPGAFIVRLVLAGCTHSTVYVDEVQFALGEGESSYNYVNNGGFEQGMLGQNVTVSNSSKVTVTGAYTVQQHNGSWGRVLQIQGERHLQGQYSQRLPLTLTAEQTKTSTFLLSGWARAQSIPTEENGTTTFQISAKLTYSDGSIQYGTGAFSPDIAGEWQFVAVPIVPNKQLAITGVDVYCSYKLNCNVAQFDDLSLTMEPCAAYTYNNDGEVVAVNQTNHDELSFGYDGADLISGSGGASGNYTYTYDNKHNITKATNENVSLSMTYDAGGRTLSTTLKGNNSAAYMKTTAEYTADGSRVSKVTDNLNNTVSYNYVVDDKATRTVKTTEPVADSKSVDAEQTRTTETKYNAIGNIKNSFISGVVSLEYGYNNGNLTQIARGGYIPGNILKKTQLYRFDRDGYGNTIETTVGNHTLASYRYNALANLLEEMEYGTGETVSYTYDNLHRQKSVTTSDWTVEYDYDGAGNLAHSVSTKNGTNVLYHLNNTFDSLGRLRTSVETDQTGKMTRGQYNQYDNKGRLQSSSYYDGAQMRSQSYTYHANGTVSVFQAANGDRIENTYDSLNRETVKKVLHDNSETYTYERKTTYKSGSAANQTTALVSKINYDYENENVTTRPSYQIRYVYDDLGNITEEYHRTSPKAGSTAYTDKPHGKYWYDAQNQLVMDQSYGPDGSVTSTYYHYDTYGNILYKYVSDMAYPDPPTMHTNVGNEETAIQYGYNDTTWRDLLTSYDGQSITYDAIGNPLSYYNGQRYTMTWSNGRQLDSTNVGGMNLSYSYNADGQRTSKSRSAYYTDEYVYYGTQLSTLIRNGVGYKHSLTFIYDDNGQALGFYYDTNLNDSNPGTKYYYVCNAQGDVLQLRDHTNAPVANYYYDSWGKLLGITDANGNAITAFNSVAVLNPIRYRGYFYDTETGFYYLNSRYYDPQIGRFINADSVISGASGSLQGYNLFEYCNNNPVNKIDSTGDWPKWIKKIGSRLVHTVKIVYRIVTSPFKAFRAKIGGGVGIGAKCEINVKKTPIKIGAATSITDSITYEKGKFDVRNSTSTNVGISIADSFDISYTNGHDHSYFDEDCTCDFMNSSFGQKSQCVANQNITSVDSSIGISFGAYFIFGIEGSISFDLEAWGDELVSIFYDNMSYGS